jgi:hypothetical protein
MQTKCRLLIGLSATALTSLLPVGSAFGHHGGGFGGGGHHGPSAPHGGMAFRHSDFFRHRDHHFLDHNHRFVHDHFFHHRHRFFFGFDFAAFGFPYWWYPYYGYPSDYAEIDYSPLDDARYWTELAMAVQSQLSAGGYYHGPIDGVMGPESREAIRKFQASEHMPATGLVDPNLLKALRLPEL